MTIAIISLPSDIDLQTLIKMDQWLDIFFNNDHSHYYWTNRRNEDGSPGGIDLTFLSSEDAVMFKLKFNLCPEY